MFGRRLSAGLGPSPGELGRVPAWWSRSHWVDVQVAAAVAARRRVCLEAQVAPATVIAVARAHACYADRATGRGCRPTNERLAADTGLHLRTVQRAREVLKRLGLVVELVRGRSHLSRAERLSAWRRGSSHRALAAEFALTAPRPRGSPFMIATPPSEARGALVSHQSGGFSTGRTDHRSRPAAGRPPNKRRPPPRRPPDARHVRLVAGVQARLPWLSRTPARRLTSLHRFALAGWTPRDVQLACDQLLTARGWSLPDRIDQPAAYLAALLRDADPAARPSDALAAAWIQERQRRAEAWARLRGERPECPHGDPGGHQPHPVTGRLTCPLCRRSSVRAPP